MYVMRALANPGPGYVTWTVFQPDFAGTYAGAPIQAGTAVIASGPLPEEIAELDFELLAGNASNDQTGWLTVGSVVINPADFVFDASELEVLLSTSDAAHQAEFRIWDVTNAVQIGATLTSVSLTPERLTQAIALTAGTVTYEAQLRNVTLQYVATCGGAKIKLTNRD